MSRIKSITKQYINEDDRLWNLAVKEDESYIANGIVVHNCRSLLIPLTVFDKWTPTEKVGKVDIETFIKDNLGKGFGKK